jgi:putative ABC transport system permease protein
MTFATLILKGIARNKVRTTLLVVSIAIAFFLYAILYGFNHVLSHGEGAASRQELLVHNAANMMIGLPRSYGADIARLDGVEAVAGAAIMPSYFKDEAATVPLLMVEAAGHMAVSGRNMAPVDGRLEDLATRRDGLLVSEEIARLHGWRVGDEVSLTSVAWLAPDYGNLWTFRVVGLFRTKPGASPMPFALGNLDYLEQSPSWRNHVHWYMLRTRDGVSNDAVATRIDARFVNSEAATKTQSADMMAQAFFAQLGNLSLIITIVIGAAFVTILLIAGNTIALSVRRRFAEIAVMRILGFTKGRIFTWLLGESLLIALLGGGVGLAIASALFPIMAAGLSGGASATLLPGSVSLSAIVLIFGVGAATGLLPALSAMRLSPVALLKEGRQ